MQIKGEFAMLYNYEELNFKVLSVFRAKHKDGKFLVSARPYGALAFRLSGKCNFKFKSKSFLVESGNVSFIPANVEYEVESFGSEIIVAHLQNCNYFEPEVYHLSNALRFKNLFNELLECWKVNCSQFRAKSIIFNVLQSIESDGNTKAVSSAFEKCLNYVEQNFCNPNVDMLSVANAGFMSKSSLQRAFNKHYGISPKAYLIKLRMNKAFNLLTQTNLTVKEVSFECGFLDEKFFSREFSQKFGFPPSSLKNRRIE